MLNELVQGNGERDVHHVRMMFGSVTNCNTDPL